MKKGIVHTLNEAIKRAPQGVDERHFNIFVEQREFFHLMNDRLYAYFMA